MSTIDNLQAASETKLRPISNGQSEDVDGSVCSPAANVADNTRSSIRNPEDELIASLNVKVQGSHTDAGVTCVSEGFVPVDTVATDGIESNAAEEIRESATGDMVAADGVESNAAQDVRESVASDALPASSPEETVPSAVEQDVAPPASSPRNEEPSAVEQETPVPEAYSGLDFSDSIPAIANEEVIHAIAHVEVIDAVTMNAEAEPVVDVEGTEHVSAIAGDGNEELASVDVDGSRVLDEVVDQEQRIDAASEEVIPEGQPNATEEDAKVMEAVAAKEEPPETLLPPEVESVHVLPHWLPKPSVHVTSIGGQVTKEELTSLFGASGQISSISYENERQDVAIVRYVYSADDPETVVAKVRENLNNTKLGDRTLIVEPFRLDSLLFIGNLTPDIDDNLLQKMFEPHGTIERAFVLHNAEGKSKGYGFVEFSLKSQALSAKMAMGNINMDGRVLRVEWSDCRRVADMFSSVLFIDRLPRDCLHIEESLRNLFGQYGKVKDCHLAIGINQQFRGFGFIDFYHSTCADKAHIGLDGHALEGYNIRVSFANPSKSAQSYKLRFGTEAAQGAMGFIGRGSFPDQTVQPKLMGGSARGHVGLPLLTSRFMGAARPGMMGMGIGMQFGRGTLDRGLAPALTSGGAGMLGPGSVAAGMMSRSPLMVGNAPRAGSAAGGNPLHVGGLRLNSQGAMTITPAAIAQVAAAQAKAREEEARARTEAAKQSLVNQAYPQQQSSEQYQRYQQNYNQQMSTSGEQQYKQSDATYPYQQAYQPPAQQQLQYHAWTQGGQQPQSFYNYSQPAPGYMQPQQGTQNPYYQQATQQAQATGAQQPYNYTQQYGQQYSQHTPDSYVQMYGQSTGQQYQHMPQQQLSSSYLQQSYSDQYSQQQQQQQQEQGQNGSTVVATVGGAMVQDTQQAYAAYYQQQAQQGSIQSETATALSVTTAASTATATASAVAMASTTAPTQQSYEAQWAAYYASQAAYQQAGYGQQQSYTGVAGSGSSYHEQASTVDVGQKRTADQMESSSQTQQAAYNYAQMAPAASVNPQQVATGYLQQVATGYSQQTATGYAQKLATGYTQQPAMGLTTYQQQTNTATPAYQHQSVSNSAYQQEQPVASLPYQQQIPGTTGYLQPSTTGSSGYDQPTVAVADSYQQQPATATGTFPPNAQGQSASVSWYDYSKRPRY